MGLTFVRQRVHACMDGRQMWALTFLCCLRTRHLSTAMTDCVFPGPSISLLCNKQCLLNHNEYLVAWSSTVTWSFFLIFILIYSTIVEFYIYLYIYITKAVPFLVIINVWPGFPSKSLDLHEVSSKFMMYNIYATVHIIILNYKVPQITHKQMF